MYYATAAEMAKLDELAVNDGLEIRQMMELAGWHMVRVFAETNIQPGASVAVMVGTGNKGGDGVAAARHLANYGYKPSILVSSRQVSADAQHHLGLAEKMKIPIYDWGTEAQAVLSESDVVLDALIGYHLQGDPHGAIGEMIHLVNAHHDKTIIAYDIPTGIDATSGSCNNPCIIANATLTLAMPKKAQDSAGAQHYGQTFIGDIGIPSYLYDQIAPGSRPNFQEGLLVVI